MVISCPISVCLWWGVGGDASSVCQHGLSVSVYGGVSGVMPAVFVNMDYQCMSMVGCWG